MEEQDNIAGESRSQLDFPVVGIGASSGGLEAVTEMFREIDQGPGMAFVLVMHLDPNHESMMAELLSNKTNVRVRQISENDHVEIDCLHIIPPGASLRIEDGLFRLDPFPKPRGIRRPIDSFLTSLANAQGANAAAVFLSGTGGDGSSGVQSIKQFGGISIVQSPEEARYYGMPYSALATNGVDFTVNANQVIPRIASYFEGAARQLLPEDDEQAKRSLSEVCEILKEGVGYDFAGYKPATLLRRLSRRMHLVAVDDTAEYIEKLRNDEDEQRGLVSDFLINVTSFFSDRESFELVRKAIFVPLVKSNELNEQLRIWIPGCSSGQEAYSIAMMLDQTCAELGKKPLIQIFATDVDESVIKFARRGSYPISTLHEIPDHYQETCVIGADDRFELHKKIRDMVRFSVHDLIQDPPFSKIDFISCRNLMIYLSDKLQHEIFPLLHFSLRSSGHMFLGSSESASRAGELFVELNKASRIYRRNDNAKRGVLNLPLSPSSSSRGSMKSNRRLAEELDFPRHVSFDASNKSIFERYGPPFIRVSEDARIVD